MSATQILPDSHAESGFYEIRLRGHLADRWADRFGDVVVTLEESGVTLLTCHVIDQAALHGLLKKVRDLGLPLVSVIPVEPGPSITLGAGPADAPDIKAQRGVGGLLTSNPSHKEHGK